MKRVLLLGGTGFIGKNLQHDLVNKDLAVRVLARSLTADSSEYIDGFEYIQGTLDDIDQLSLALSGVDVVVHMVSTTVPSTSNLDPVFDIQSNLVAIVRLLELMKEQGVKRIIFLSSGGTVYGNPEYLPVDEKHPLNPICSYGIVKIAIENYLHIYKALHGFSILTLRVSNPYGPFQGKLGVQGVIGTFMNRIINNVPIEIWGDGSVRRDYIYIYDLVEIISKAVLQDDIEGVFNIGSGHSVSITELLTVISEITGKTAIVNYKPARSFDIENIYLDISKVQQVVGWQPSTDIRTGVQRYYSWLQS